MVETGLEHRFEIDPGIDLQTHMVGDTACGHLTLVRDDHLVGGHLYVHQSQTKMYYIVDNVPMQVYYSGIVREKHSLLEIFRHNFSGGDIHRNALEDSVRHYCMVGTSPFSSFLIMVFVL